MTRKRLQAFLSAYHGVTGIRQVLVNFIGPGRVWIVAHVDIGDDLRGAEVTSLVRGIESGMRRESEHVYRVDIVPTGGAHAAGGGSRLTGDPGMNRVDPKVLLRIANLTVELPPRCEGVVTAAVLVSPSRSAETSNRVREAERVSPWITMLATGTASVDYG